MTLGFWERLANFLTSVKDEGEFDLVTLKFEKNVKITKNWHISASLQDIYLKFELQLHFERGACNARTCVWSWHKIQGQITA